MYKLYASERILRENRELQFMWKPKEGSCNFFWGRVSVLWNYSQIIFFVLRLINDSWDFIKLKSWPQHNFVLCDLGMKVRLSFYLSEIQPSERQVKNFDLQNNLSLVLPKKNIFWFWHNFQVLIFFDWKWFIVQITTTESHYRMNIIG